LLRAGENIAMRRELAHLRESQQQKVNFIIGQTAAMKAVINQALRAAAASVSVLITGETGTGKDLLAQFIHKNGQRSNKPYIPENCAAIQNTVLESELFGYEAGAFTGAERRKHGLMEVADGGILFLDEISSMPLDIQAKILRAIEDQSIRRVGGTSSIKVDLQLIAASNRNLLAMIEEGLFRQDLYYRLKVVDLHLPPLRDRRIDIPELVGYFIRQYNSRLGMNVSGISQRALQVLMDYRWPGNIRELNNVIERAVLFCDGEEIDLPHLSTDLIHPS
jgi:two-component system, NtrC family, response regulator AtoC